MPDFRCYAESPPSGTEGEIHLSPLESNHLVAANRARVGDPVCVFDGHGKEWDTQLTLANKRAAVLQILQHHHCPPPAYKIALGQALPKGKLMESIIRKATEIGAQSIFPLITSRCEAKIAPQKTEAKNAKWATAALEGAKQSGNPYLLDIEPLSNLDSFLEQAQDYDLKLTASLETEALSLRAQLATFQSNHAGLAPKSVIWLIGPEGDLSPGEYEQAKEAGFVPTTLGPHVMRSETAAAFALSITQYELATQPDSTRKPLQSS